MDSRILGQMKALVTRTDSPEEIQHEHATRSPSVELYTCHECRSTYIKNDMETCPNCDTAVERTPSFDELGIGTHHRY